MQTFLPYSDFKLTASVLDRQRLGKQRVEAFQILNVLTGKSKSNGWKNHPAVKMWRGYELALAHYGVEICNEWIRRGYKDTMLPRFHAYIEELHTNHKSKPYSFTLPSWIGNEDFHRSHRSNLVRKKPEFYKEFWPKVDNTLPYIWPV